MDRSARPEKEKKSGISLRKKRSKMSKIKPTIGAPKLVPMPPMPGARGVGQPIAPPGAPPQVRSRDKDRVADMVKKRMSTRFTMIPGEGEDIPDIPAMPSIPAALMAGGKGGLQGPTGPTGSTLDVSAFRDPAFDPEKFVSTVLADASNEEIQDYQKRLQDIRNRASTDLQKNVFVNRTQFIIISKEIDKLKGEMRTLRSLLTDLHANTSSLKTESSFSSTASDVQARKAANRSSVADLNALHMSHLQALWKEVEGAQKFLPSVPGRHIVVDSRNWIELNAATWKARRIVHMVLLNDHLLVATVKKKRTDNNPNAGGRPMPQQIKHVAEKCWALSDIEMVDLQSNRKGVSNAINLRVGKESFVYQNDDPGKKADLLRQFKKSSDELRKAMRAETEDSMRRRDSVHFLTGRDPLLLEHGDLLNSLSAQGAGTAFFTVDGQTKNLRYIETRLDDLDEFIAHRKFDEAVAEVSSMRSLGQNLSKSNTLVSELINLKLDERSSKLASIITADLVANTGHKSVVKANITWLVKLDYEDRAREAFLEARSKLIKKRTRQVQFEGDVSAYISQIAIVQFTLIKNTVEIYNTCFDHRLASALVRWAHIHVKEYIELLDRQLETVNPESDVYKSCMDFTKSHSAMLVDAGLDFKELRRPVVRKSRARAAVGLGLQ
ncbi:hypothetical protein EX30DRAFT_338268 [Ascodesmis nigricans]|uniref:Exocyst complex component EXO84 n=1 Tax=Ascodesmis nigricans TaxID=341454 RepID=A0A4S2N3F4_9PEZI|nr:hypothetical protein EX30DRAFT_338268 [Ascodesmis nigricans]